MIFSQPSFTLYSDDQGGSWLNLLVVAGRRADMALTPCH